VNRILAVVQGDNTPVFVFPVDSFEKI